MKERKFARQGAYIASRREEKGLSVAELADQIGIAPFFIKRWEKGVSLPDDESFPRLAEALDLPMLSLFTGTPIQPGAEEDTARAVWKAKAETGRRKNVTKHAALFCAAMLSLFLILMDIVQYRQLNRAVRGLEDTWGIDLSENMTKEFAISNQDFLGEGETFYLFAGDGGGAFYLNFKEGPSAEAESLMYSFLHSLSVPPEYLPDFSHPYLWQIVDGNDERDQMVCFFDLETEQYYFIEEFY